MSDPAPQARPLPQYRCHKVVSALKIRQVVKHALPEANTTAEQDAAFEASAAFCGGNLFPVDESYHPIAVDAEFYRKHKPEPGGYFVMYADGYISYSPAKAFEEGYTRI